jgi:hypothetical protein
MTDSEQPPTENPVPKPAGVTLSRKTLAILGGSVLAVIVAMAITIGVVATANTAQVTADPSAVKNSIETPSTATSEPVVTAEPSAVKNSIETPSTATSEPVVTPDPVVVAPPPAPMNKIGDAVTNFGVTLTIHSIEPMATIPVITGAPITGEPGTQLYLVKTTFVNNTKTPVDLSCSLQVYMRFYDTNERMLAQVFETHRLAGNPPCNYQLIQGLSHEWNFAIKGVAGATLERMTFLDTDARQAGDQGS